MKYIFLFFVLIIVGVGGLLWLSQYMKSPEYRNTFSGSGENTNKTSAEPGNAQEEPANGNVVLENDAKQDYVNVAIQTDRGNIVMRLYPKIAPKTVENFVKLAKERFYDGTKFHRVISDFMIQGGDPYSRTGEGLAGTGGPGYTFEDEINPKALGLSDDDIRQLEAQGYSYDFTLTSLAVNVGAIAMANSGPNTNGSQFFIVTQRDQPHLNGKHTVFGEVVEGMDVVRAIAQDDAILKISVFE